MKLNLRDLINTLFILLLVLAYFSLSFLFSGCTNFKARSANGDEFLYQTILTAKTAEKVEVTQYDSVGVPWLKITINDPNSKVNPGSIYLKEPKTGIGLTGEAK